MESKEDSGRRLRLREKVKVLVTVENEQGEVYTFLEEDDWLYENQIEEGSIWPEEIRQRICTI